MCGTAVLCFEPPSATCRAAWGSVWNYDIGTTLTYKGIHDGRQEQSPNNNQQHVKPKLVKPFYPFTYNSKVILTATSAWWHSTNLASSASSSGLNACSSSGTPLTHKTKTPEGVGGREELGKSSFSRLWGRPMQHFLHGTETLRHVH